MIGVYLLEIIIAVLVIVAIVFSKARSTRRREVLEQTSERYRQSGNALIQYIRLHRQCSEDAAYQYLALFVEKHNPMDNRSSMNGDFARDRQSLIDSAQIILLHDPDEIDKI